MAKTILEKMFFKPQYSIAILHVPEELQSELHTNETAKETLTETYDFILAFYTMKSELEKEISAIKKALNPRTLVWIAYPKGKLLQTDLNRDILHEYMKHHGLDGVSIVSINQTWSAMRFKK